MIRANGEQEPSHGPRGLVALPDGRTMFKRDLDRGEAEGITVALELDADLLLMINLRSLKRSSTRPAATWHSVPQDRVRVRHSPQERRGPEKNLGGEDGERLPLPFRRRAILPQPVPL